jgi:class 3 adenylate cyclase
MFAAVDDGTLFMELRDQRRLHDRRSKLILLMGNWVLVAAGLTWCIYFAFGKNWPLVAMDVCIIGAGLAGLNWLRRGQILHATLLLNAAMYVVLVGMSLFVDVPDAAAARSLHLFLIPLAIASILLLKNERPLLRHCVPLLCLATVIFFSCTRFGFVTQLALPDEVRVVGAWFNSVIAMAVLYAVVNIFFGDIHRMESQLHKANNRFVGLVGDMFPKSIAERLLATGTAFAERHTNCSILFADIAGFTPLAAKLDPVALVALLSDIFARFDACVDDAGLTKIKTIGDAFMVAAGVPSPDQDHARKLVAFGQQLLMIVRDVEGIELRIGISSGDVVAGVIGQSRQVYDVWGDVVNMASRMESQGQIGRIQVSQETYALTRECFDYEECGEFSIKGKVGMHKVYLL